MCRGDIAVAVLLALAIGNLTQSFVWLRQASSLHHFPLIQTLGGVDTSIHDARIFTLPIDEALFMIDAAAVIGLLP